MKTLSALGVLAGGFLFAPTPKAIVTTVLWVASRTRVTRWISIEPENEGKND